MTKLRVAFYNALCRGKVRGDFCNYAFSTKLFFQNFTCSKFSDLKKSRYCNVLQTLQCITENEWKIYIFIYISLFMETAATHNTGWSKSLCLPDDYNTEIYLAQSDCLTANRQGQRDTRLIQTPSVFPNSNYVIMVSDWNCLIYFCMFFCTVIIRCTETFDHPAFIKILFRIYNSYTTCTLNFRVPVPV
jgi:hypothetical protein